MKYINPCFIIYSLIFICLCSSVLLFLSPCIYLASKLYYLAAYLLCLAIYQLPPPALSSSLSLPSRAPSFQAAYLLSLTPALGVWALTGSLRVTGAPCQYLPGLATLCAVVREWGREGDTRDAPQHREIK